MGIEIEVVTYGYINYDFTFSSFDSEQVPQILSHNLPLNQSLHDNVSF
jgi:hypothetical protein